MQNAPEGYRGSVRSPWEHMFVMSPQEKREAVGRLRAMGKTIPRSPMSWA